MEMRLEASVQMRQEAVMALTVCGGATQSIFPQVEAWLLDKTDRQTALNFVARRKNMKKYRSMIDFLFCEIFIEFRQACFDFYKGVGTQLKEQITVEQWRHYNRALLVAVELAYHNKVKNGGLTWESFRIATLRLAAA